MRGVSFTLTALIALAGASLSQEDEAGYLEHLMIFLWYISLLSFDISDWISQTVRSFSSYI